MFILSYEDAATICELNPKYDADGRQGITARRARINAMIHYASLNRAARRNHFFPNPFDANDLRMLDRIRTEGIRLASHFGIES
jgi:hypothetical protein